MAVGGSLRRIVNVATEANDVVDALWDALPSRFRSKVQPGDAKGRVPAWKKWRDVYRHWDKVNIGKAVGNLIKNQAEDALFGRLGRLGSKANRNLGLEHGVQFGPAM